MKLSRFEFRHEILGKSGLEWNALPICTKVTNLNEVYLNGGYTVPTVEKMYVTPTGKPKGAKVLMSNCHFCFSFAMVKFRDIHVMIRGGSPGLSVAWRLEKDRGTATSSPEEAPPGMPY